MNPPVRFSATFFALGYFALPVAANTVLPPGNLVARDASGNAVLAADAAGLTIAGVAFGNGSSPLAPNERHTVDTTGIPAGNYRVCLRTGIFRFRNSSSSPIQVADLGTVAYVENETTVAKATTNSVLAGVTLGLEGASYVWFCLGPLPGATPFAGVVPPSDPPAQG